MSERYGKRWNEKELVALLYYWRRGALKDRRFLRLAILHSRRPEASVRQQLLNLNSLAERGADRRYNMGEMQEHVWDSYHMRSTDELERLMADEARQHSEVSSDSSDEWGPWVKSAAKRKGQAAFRSALMSRYGEACMVTGCTTVEALEAAHIEWFSKGGAMDPENGLLLRADVHLLFDQDLLAIHPSTMTVRVASHLTDYREFDGHSLCQNHVARPSESCLRTRWDQVWWGPA